MSALLNLANIPAPTLIEALDYETILAAKLAKLHSEIPDYQLLESDPAYKLLEIVAYDELILRQRVNDAARGLMLAFAVGSDLEQIGARYDVGRLDNETDERLRTRIQQGYHLLAAAGPSDAYKQHALGVSNAINDVSVVSLADGQVTVTVFASRDIDKADVSPEIIENGVAAFGVHDDNNKAFIIAENQSAVLAAVRVQLNDERVRPLTDEVQVRMPEIIPFDIDAVITVYRGPDPSVVERAANAALNTYLNSIKKLGFDATRAGIIAAITVDGVQNTVLNSPVSDVVITPLQIALAMNTSLVVGGIDD